MELYTKYKPYLAIQASQKNKQAPFLVGSLEPTNENSTKQEE